MIRYPISADALNALIEAERPGWRDRARQRTARFLADGRYDEQSPIWGEIKAVYMRLQHDKCLFCERKLAGEPYGSVEHDLEHFRPKNSVRAWPPRGSGLPFPFGTVEECRAGITGSPTTR